VLCCFCHLVILVDNQFQIQHLLPKKTCTLLKMMDFTYFHSILKYGIKVWSSSTDSKWIFQLHNRIVRIMKGPLYTSSCKPTFEALEILVVPAQFRPIIPLMAFTAHNWEHFTFNFSVHGTNRRSKLHHRPTTHLTFQKRVY